MGRFILVFLLFFGLQAKADSVKSCSSLFAGSFSSNSSGALFLHQKNSNIHTSRPVKLTTQRAFLKTGQRFQKPEHKIDAWLKYLEQVSSRANKDPSALLRLKNYYYKLYVTKAQDIPESYYDLQVQIARERGHGNIQLDESTKAQHAEVLIKDQKKSLDDWIEYLVSADSSSYPMWAKLWAFNSMVKLSKFNKETSSFGSRNKGQTAPFPELNREAFALVIDALVKKLNKDSLEEIKDPEFLKLLDGANFGKLYARALVSSHSNAPATLSVIEGRWVTYPKGNNYEPLVKSLEGKNTGWCTAGDTTAKKQLENGDFHVYYSLDQYRQPTIPRVAIRMEDSQIAEVRGIGKDQNLDEHIASSSVVTDKLKKFGSEGEKYTKKSANMARLTSIDHKSKQGLELSREDLKFLYEIDNKVEGFGYQNDPRIEELTQNRNKKKDIAFIFDVSENEVSLSTSPIDEIFFGKIKVHIGSLRLRGLKYAENLTLPEFFIGNLIFPDLVSVHSLKFSQYFRGDIYLNNLTTVQGFLKLPSTMNGNLYMEALTSGKGVEFPNVIYGDLQLYKVESANDLKLPRVVKGHLSLMSLKYANNLILPQELDSLNLTALLSTESLKFPRTMKALYLSHLTSTQGLNLPQDIEGNLSLKGINFNEYNKLKNKPNVNGSVDLRDKILGTHINIINEQPEL